MTFTRALVTGGVGQLASDLEEFLAERSEVVSLPVHPYLEVSDLDTIITTVREVLGA